MNALPQGFYNSAVLIYNRTFKNRCTLFSTSPVSGNKWFYTPFLLWLDYYHISLNKSLGTVFVSVQQSGSKVRRQAEAGPEGCSADWHYSVVLEDLDATPWSAAWWHRTETWVTVAVIWASAVSKVQQRHEAEGPSLAARLLSCLQLPV